MSDYEYMVACGKVQELSDELTEEQLKEIISQLSELV